MTSEVEIVATIMEMCIRDRLEDGQFAKLTPAGVEYTDEAGNVIEPKVTHIDWDLDMAEKGGYPDFMLKEIHEQPRVVRDTLVGRMTPAGELDIDELGLSLEELDVYKRQALLGADIATVPMAALKKCLHHPLTDQGLASFEADWQKVVAQA